ncbi:hypothetical protein INP51_04275 [Blautia liquoris]|uniref:Uncharacterized protein n=1 Tax=Blautia liquoris TaxID=2779518 RepID=A0A7M2RIL6_9FIRM|nr:hypothetical protein [Blautia liquoris]QOV20173.1 hypothetical protein INP51_04275 [Blautia liquoris]
MLDAYPSLQNMYQRESRVTPPRMALYKSTPNASALELGVKKIFLSYSIWEVLLWFLRLTKRRFYYVLAFSFA